MGADLSCGHNRKFSAAIAFSWQSGIIHNNATRILFVDEPHARPTLAVEYYRPAEAWTWTVGPSEDDMKAETRNRQRTAYQDSETSAAGTRSTMSQSLARMGSPSYGGAVLLSRRNLSQPGHQPDKIFSHKSRLHSSLC